MSWLFREQLTETWEGNKTEREPKKKRPVIDPIHGLYFSPFIDHELLKILKAASLSDDADEVIACLQDSPRYRRALCKTAEDALSLKREELAQAEEAVRKACHIAT